VSGSGMTAWIFSIYERNSKTGCGAEAGAKAVAEVISSLASFEMSNRARTCRANRWRNFFQETKFFLEKVKTTSHTDFSKMEHAKEKRACSLEEIK